MNKKCIECGTVFNALRKNHKFCSKYCSRKNWNNNNISHLRKKEKEWRDNNKEKRKIDSKTWREKNKERIKINKQKWHQLNKVRILHERRTDIHKRLKHSLRSRLHTALKFNYKTGSAVNDLGCSIEQFKLYLESKWQDGMTWDNYGRDGWHIDHIIPLDAFDLSNSIELKKACHYTNLQPLWAHDNLSKNNTV